MKLRKILHLADLHLGFEHAYLGDRAAQRAEESTQALERIVDWVLDSDNQIGAVLIAGDLFETHQPVSLLLGRVIQILKQIPASGRALVTVPGNHDEYSYPDSVYRLHGTSWPGVLVTGPRLAKVARFELDDVPCAVHSLAFTAGLSAKRLEGPAESQPAGNADPVEDSAAIRVALLHGTLDADPADRTYRIDSSVLNDWGFSYAALGHIHKPCESRFGDCLAVYPGTPNGKGLDDPGTDRLTVVSFPGARMQPASGARPQPERASSPAVSAGRAAIEHIPFSIRPIQTRQIDLHAYHDQEQLITRLEKDLTSEAILRLVLHGLRFDDFDAQALQGRLSRLAFHLEIDDRSVGISAADIAALEHQPTVKGLFVRRMRERIAAAEGAGNADEQEHLRNALVRGLEAFETVTRGRPV